jgi:DNA-directed RNA polymerase specialized sigma24 family protein
MRRRPLEAGGRPLEASPYTNIVYKAIQGMPRPPMPLDYDDLLQEGLLTAHRCAPLFDGRVKLQTYLITKIKQHFIDLYRRYGTTYRDKRIRCLKTSYQEHHARATNITPLRIAIAREELHRLRVKPTTASHCVVATFMETLCVKQTAKRCGIQQNQVYCVLKSWRDNVLAGRSPQAPIFGGQSEHYRKRRKTT